LEIVRERTGEGEFLWNWKEYLLERHRESDQEEIKRKGRNYLNGTNFVRGDMDWGRGHTSLHFSGGPKKGSGK